MADVACPPVTSRSTARRVWLNTHLTLALVAGAFLALMGLSGAALVLKGALLRHDFGAATFEVTAAEQPWASADAWVANARRAYPHAQAIVSLAAPSATPLPIDAALLTTALDDGGYGFVTIDPRTARPLGFFRYGEGWLFTLLDFHRYLLPESLEEIGEILVTGLGVALLVSIGSGLYLWWPRQGAWRGALSLRGGPRLWHSLHTTTAVFLVLPLSLLATTGILLAQPRWLTAITPPAAPLSTASIEPCRPVHTYDEAISAALTATNARRFASVSTMPGGDYLVTVHDAGQSHGRQGSVRVQADCGRVMDAASTQGVASQRVQSLHAELLLGRAGQVIVFLTGMALPVLYLSGLTMWWRRRTRRQR